MARPPAVVEAWPKQSEEIQIFTQIETGLIMTRTDPVFEVSQGRVRPTLVNLALERLGEFAHNVQRDQHDEDLPRVGWRGAKQSRHASRPAWMYV